jgi:DNA-binding CsgD family transcriptional regulator
VGVAMVERDGALAALDELLASAALGRGRALVVVGEAGLGKTALLEQALVLAGDRFAIGVGRADVAEAALPFGLVNQALEPLLGTEEDEEPGGGTEDVPGSGAPHLRHGRAPAGHLHSVLRRLRGRAVRPLLIALDDAHWADPDSLVLLRLICRRIPALPVAVLVTARPWPPELLRAAEELSAEGLVDLERLAPLTPAAAASLLLERVAGTATSGQIERAVAACAGNPLLLEHVTAGLLAGRELRFEDRPGAGSSWARRLLISPFAGVDEDARRYLRAASVLGSRFRPEVAAEVAGLGWSEAAQVQEALSETGLLADGGDGWARFSHDLVRHAIYEETAPVRLRLHEAAFRALLRRHASAGEVAEHAAAARLVGDPEAQRALARAGREALQSGAPGTARRHLEAALELGRDGTPLEVLLDLSQARRAGGDHEGAASVCRELLCRPGLPHQVRLSALLGLAHATFLQGQAGPALAQIDEAVRLAEAEHRPELAAVAVADQAVFSVMHLGPATALPLAEKARDLGARAGGRAALVADAAWGTCAYLSGDPQGLEVSEIAAAHWRLAPAPAPEVPYWANPEIGFANLCVYAERFEQVEPALQAIAEEAERRSDPTKLFQTLLALVELRCRQGRLSQALSTSDHLLDAAEFVPYALPLAAAARAQALLELGRLAEAAEWCGRLSGMAAEEGALAWALGLDLHRRGLLALRLDQPETAAGLFERLERLALERGLGEPCLILWPGPAVTAYLGAGREEDAARLVCWLEARPAAHPARWPAVTAARGHAALAERRGETGAAVAHLEGALAACAQLDVPLARVETLVDYGALLTRLGDLAQARPPLAEALRIAEGCGAAWHAERARAAWRRAGGRGARTPAGALTPQEATVARLAQTGRTNREIAEHLYLSVNTVETHLRHVYRKLGIERRWQLIARARAGQEL